MISLIMLIYHLKMVIENKFSNLASNLFIALFLDDNHQKNCNTHFPVRICHL